MSLYDETYKRYDDEMRRNASETGWYKIAAGALAVAGLILFGLVQESNKELAAAQEEIGMQSARIHELESGEQVFIVPSERAEATPFDASDYVDEKMQHL